MENIHITVNELRKRLGYSIEDGCCHGLALRWIEACLLGEENFFHSRIASIMHGPHGMGAELWPFYINKTKEKIIKGEQLAIENINALDILCFYESVELYQSPTVNFSFFNATYSQHNISSTANLAAAEKVLQRGGLKEIYSESSIYTEEELTNYFDALTVILKQFGSTTESVGILLANVKHSIAIVYQPGEGWKFMDVNQYPLQFFSLDTKELAKFIKQGFSISCPAEFMALNVSLIAIGDYALSKNLTQQLERFKESHFADEIIRERAQRKEEGSKINLAYIAARHGDAALIAKLAEQGADLNCASEVDISPAFIAAQMGHANVIVELAKYGVDLNLANRIGVAPVWVAAINGHANVIAKLAQQGVNLNFTTKCGTTPASIAAQLGRVDVVAELGTRGADLNLPNKIGVTPAWAAACGGHAKVIGELAKYKASLIIPIKDGFMPIHIAAQNGHTDVIAELAKHGVNLNAAVNGNGFTAAHLAAHKGHPNVIAELAKHGVDLNFSNKNCTTPVCIAAQMGKVEILIELIKHGADLSLPYVATFSSQMQFATSLERDAATRMIEVIYRRLDGEGNVAVTPYDMAYVMGHKEIVRLLERQFASQLHENSENIAVNTKKQGVKSANKNANIKQQPLEVVEGKKTKKRQFGDAIENKGSSCKLMRIDYLCNRDNVSLFSLKNEVATKPVVQRQCGYN